MSFIYRNFLAPARARTARNIATRERFKKAWPTELVGGELVYSSNLYLYSGGAFVENTQLDRFLSILGISKNELRENDFSDVKNVYLTLDPKKYSYIPPSASTVASLIDSQHEIDDEFEIKIIYGGDTKRYISAHKVDPITGLFDKQAVMDDIHADPLRYIAGIYKDSTISSIKYSDASTYMSYNLYDPYGKYQVSELPAVNIEYENEYDTLALFDHGEGLFEQIGEPYQEQILLSKQGEFGYSQKYVIEYSYKLKFKKKEAVTSTSLLVADMITIASVLQNGSISTDRKDVYLAQANTVIKKIVREMGTFSSTLFNTQGQLKVTESDALKAKDFVDMLAKSLDSDYTKKDASLLQRALTGFAIIAAVFVTISTAGAGSWTIGAVSTGLFYGSLILGLAGLTLAATGAGNTSQMKTIGQFSQVIGYLSQIIGILAVFQSMFREITRKATEEATKEAAKEAAKETTQEVAKESVKEAEKSIVKNISTWVNNVTTLANGYFTFFGSNKDTNTIQDDQMDKEKDIEPYFVTVEAMHENDALHTMHQMIENSTGGRATENLIESTK